MEKTFTSKTNAQLLDKKLAQLEKARVWTPRLISKLEALLQSPDDFQLFRINPLQFAKERGVDEQEAIDLFLHGAKIGLFKMEWQVLCPNCGDTVESFGALSSVHPNYYCNLCRFGSEVHLDDYIQISFTINPAVREIKYHYPDLLSVEEFYFKYHFNQSARFPGGPTFLEAGSKLARGLSYIGRTKTVSFPVEGKDETFIGHDLINNTGFLIQVKGEPLPAEAEPQKIRFTLRGGKFEDPEREMRPGKAVIEIKNAMTSRGSVLILQMPAGYQTTTLEFEPYLTGNRLLTSQTFRNLFRSETVEGAEGIGVKDLTLLFTDLKGSTAMYERIGDLKAFSLVQLHFDRLGKAIQANHGAIVKTIGDAVMASFEKPADAVKAALEMLQEIEQFNEEHGGKEIILKVGIHRGASIAVNLNDRLDYFGQTVNIAARVQGLADAEEIYVTKEVLDSVGVADLLKDFDVKPTTANLKGIQKTMQVARITHHGSAAPPPPPPVFPANIEDVSQGEEPVKRRRVKPASLVMGFIALAACYFLFSWVSAEKNLKAQLEQQKKSKAAMDQAAALKAKQDAALPRCPLIFPLLDKSHKVSPTGSYLSYLAMQRLAHMPQANIKLPDVWDLFNDQGLFSSKPADVAKNYSSVLASHFDTKDRAEGQLVRIGNTYKVVLKFSGSKPEKKFQKTFGIKGLRWVPGWMASCAQDWMGLKLNKAQTAYLAQPLYSSDDDFKRGITLETAFRAQAASNKE